MINLTVVLNFKNSHQDIKIGSDGFNLELPYFTFSISQLKNYFEIINKANKPRIV